MIVIRCNVETVYCKCVNIVGKALIKYTNALNIWRLSTNVILMMI